MQQIKEHVYNNLKEIELKIQEITLSQFLEFVLEFCQNSRN